MLYSSTFATIESVQDELNAGTHQPPLACYASRQTYVEVSDTYSEGGTHKETLHPQSKAKVMNKRQGGKVTIRQIVDS